MRETAFLRPRSQSGEWLEEGKREGGMVTVIFWDSFWFVLGLVHLNVTSWSPVKGQ